MNKCNLKGRKRDEYFINLGEKLGRRNSILDNIKVLEMQLSELELEE